jgi:murein DD-endopeptidase MepM/ murein hydrolase activator NlpD
LISCTVSKNPKYEAVRKLQKGKLRDDTSYVYSLPYQKGKSHLVVQGYYSGLSHKNRIAIDFKMKRGTPITAARNGVVVRAVESNDQGGLDAKYRQYANMVVIEHPDKSRAGYWHLQKDGVVVNVGDTVKTGQVIAYSGKTGYSAFPHLHFLVWTSGNNQWQNLPSRFMTKKGPRFLRPLRWYRNKN